jgi:hypothetical protein
VGPYKDVELGYPSQPDELIAKWAEDKTRPTETIYPWVAVDVVRDLIAKHGGAVRGTVPPGVVMLMAPEAEEEKTKTLYDSRQDVYAPWPTEEWL